MANKKPLAPSGPKPVKFLLPLFQVGGKCRVFVHKNLSVMHSYLRADGWRMPRDAAGFTITKGRTSSKAGTTKVPVEIHFASSHLTPEIVAHEALHATFGVASHHNLDFSLLRKASKKGWVKGASGNEEALCYVCGVLVADIVKEVKERGL